MSRILATWVSAHSLYIGPPNLPIAMNTVNRLMATIVSSLTTYSSLEMAQIDTAAAEDRIAVLETRELPGRLSRIDCAFDFGSGVMVGGVGVVLWKRAAVRAGVNWRRSSAVVGRRRAAPV